MKYLKTLQVEPGLLVPYPGNAKEHDEGALDESVAELGQFRAVLARQLGDGSMQLLAGHGTTAAVQRSLAKKIRVELIDADDDTALKIVLADNEIGRKRGYDEKALAVLLGQLDAGAGFTGTGFDSAGYDDLMARLSAAADTPLPLGGPDENAWSSPTLEDDRVRYETKGTRTVSFDFPHATFVWLAEQMAVLREQYGAESNADLLVHLIEVETGSKAPASLDEAAGSDDDEPEDAPEPSGMDEFMSSATEAGNGDERTAH